MWYRGITLLGLSSLCAGQRVFSREGTFNWTALPPSTNLTRTPCYDSFECSRLTVPLQYSNTSAGEAQIALLISPSKFSKDDPNYLGPLLFNPGGPGGSGVQFLLQLDSYFRALVGPGYDIVGFDPRGIGFSIPAITFFDSPAEALALFGTYPVSLNESVPSFGRSYVTTQIMSNLAEERNKLVMESVGTVAIAHDMLGITKAFGYEKLTYWGISYGTVIGATFAATFPDKINRMILDGVLSSPEYYADGVVTTSLLEASNALESFYTACVAAGPNLCALHEATPDLIRARINTLLSSLHLAPVAASNSSVGIVDDALLLSQLYQTLVSAYSTGKAFAQAVVELEAGNGAGVYQGSISAIVDGSDQCPATSQQTSIGYIDVTTPVLCGDGQGKGLKSLEESRVFYEELVGGSGFWNTLYGRLNGPCANWNIRAKDVFNGSFTTNTSFPILLISNTFDPLTPIENGRNISAGFAGSVLLEQNATGHTSLSAFSTCTALAIRSYLTNGTLPAPGTVCQTDTALFENPSNSSAQGGVTFPPGSPLGPTS